MTQAPLLQDLATVMIIASIMVFVMRRLRQPALIGYLLAGLVIGPYTPPFSLVRDIQAIRTISDLGLVFLMFAIGLEFSLPRFRKAGPAAGVSALIVVLGMLAVGYALGRLFGWSRADSAFLGAVLSISGSSMIAKVFLDLGLTQERFAGAVFGLMISDDIAAMVMLSVVSGLGAAAAPGLESGAHALARIAFFVLLFLLAGLLLVPRVIRAVSAYGSPEMTGVLTIGLCLGSAFAAAELGFSMALGAFLIGAVVASTTQAAAIGEWMQPIRGMFSALFFVSAGMLVDPSLLWEHLGSVALIAVATIVARTALGLAASLATGHTTGDAVRIGVSIAQIGEFSFVIAALGVSLGLASGFLYPIAVVVSSVSMFFTPLFIARGDALAAALNRAVPGLEPRLEAYRAAVHRERSGGAAAGGAIFGRYLVRLVAYAAVLLGSALLERRARDAGVPAAGALAALFAAALPLSLLVSKYASHVFLLLATQLMSLPAMTWAFRVVDIRFLYGSFHAATLAALGAALAVLATPPPRDAAFVAGAAAVLALAGVLLAGRLAPLLEWLERRLDEALGRATSEPTRYAILMTGDGRSLFYDLTEQLPLPEDAWAAGRSIEASRLRAASGATVAAIYRDGEHLTNPPPDTVLRARDLVVLLGDSAQRERARRLLLSGEA